MAARLSTLRAGSFLHPGRFLIIISVRGLIDPRAIVRLEGLDKLKKSTSSGTRTGDLPACNIVPPPTTLPIVSKYSYKIACRCSRNFHGNLIQIHHSLIFPVPLNFILVCSLFNRSRSSSEYTASSS
jgi:hypothetical protein